MAEDPLALPKGWPRAGTMGLSNIQRAFREMGITTDQLRAMSPGQLEKVRTQAMEMARGYAAEAGSPYTRISGERER
jgi:membrane carboxypeptidase/penicillin-binding protein